MDHVKCSLFIQHFSPQFGDAAATANAILNSGADYDQGKMMYNRYKSVVSYDTTALPLFSQGLYPLVYLKDSICTISIFHLSRDCDGS